MAYLDKGFYEGEAVSFACVEIGTNKAPAVEVQVKVDSRITLATKEKVAIEPQYRKITIWGNSRDQKDKERALDSLKALGWDGSDLTTFKPNGKRCVLRNTAPESETNKYTKWFVSTAPAPEAKKSDPLVAMKLNAMFGAAQPAATTSHEVPEGELPF